MKILVASPDYFAEDLLSQLREFSDVDSKKLSREQLLEEIGNYDAILTRVDTKLDKQVLERAINLKAIGTATTGLDHIDTEFANAKGIKIFSLTGAYTIPTAEHTFSLILSLIKRIPWAHNSVTEGKWERQKFFTTELEGKILGVIGFGRIGSRIAKYAKSFGMDIITFDPYINKALAEEVGAKITTLDDVLENSDIITIHAFLSPETRGMINSDAFSKMRDTTLLVNVARGEIIDDDALLDALENKKIAGAALDVFSQEPLPSDSKLVRYSKHNGNLLLTPHIAASTKESVYNGAKEIIQKLKEFLIK